MTNRKRFDALTGLRALAVTMVFLYHNRKFWNTQIPVFVLRLLNELHTGVSVFFVLSGFLIAYTYKDRPMQSLKTYGNYLVVRGVRIFPVFLLLLTLKYVCTHFPSLEEALLTYTLFHGFSDRYNLNGLPQAWSLTVELSFYTVAPIIYYFTTKNVVKTVALLLLHLLVVYLIGFTWHAINGNKGYFLYGWYFIFTSTFAGRFVEFFVGLLLAYCINYKKDAWLVKWKYKTIIGGLSALIITYGLSFFELDLYHLGTENPVGLFIRNVIFPIAIAVFIAGLINEQTLLKKLLQTKLLVLLGNASFIFYLIHIGFINERLRRIAAFNNLHFAILWLIAIPIYWLIEKPLYKFLREKLLVTNSKL